MHVDDPEIGASPFQMTDVIRQSLSSPDVSGNVSGDLMLCATTQEIPGRQDKGWD